jgi:hypothetical protein
MAFDEVEIPLENEAPSAGGHDPDLVAGSEPGLLESLDGQRRLMLRADASRRSRRAGFRGGRDGSVFSIPTKVVA